MQQRPNLGSKFFSSNLGSKLYSSKLYSLRALGLAFWLLLPGLGFVTWVGSGLGQDWLLSRAYRTEKVVLLEPQPTRSTTLKVVSIRVDLDQRQQRSIVTVKTIGSALKTLTFEFPITEIRQVEAEIAQELGLPQTQVRSLMRSSAPRSSDPAYSPET